MKILGMKALLFAGLLGPAGNAVDDMIASLQEEAGTGRTFTLPEEDVNDFVRRAIAVQSRKEIKSAVFSFREGFFRLVLTVDLEGMQPQSTSTTGRLLGSLLSGVQVIDVEGDLTVNDGQGVYSTRQATLNGMTIPAVLVDQVLSYLGSTLKPPFDPTKPFTMPGGVKSVEFQPGKVVVKT